MEKVVGEATDNSVVRRISDAIRRRETVDAILTNYTKDNVRFWVELHLQPLDFDDSKQMYLGIQRQLTPIEAATRLKTASFTKQQKPKLVGEHVLTNQLSTRTTPRNCSERIVLG